MVMHGRFAWLIHVFLVGCILLLSVPLYLAVITASHETHTLMQGAIPYWFGHAFLENMRQIWQADLAVLGGGQLREMLMNSLWMAFGIAVGKITLALFAAFALVYFEFPGKKWMMISILMTLMLPIEVRLVPTFELVAMFHGLNHMWGLTSPLMVSATATLLFKQYFSKIPPQLVEAAKLDGVGPLRFFIDILLPLSKIPMASLFVVLFIYGWNQYLWPLVLTTDPHAATVVMGMRYVSGASDLVPQWNVVMSIVLIALCPPCFVLLLMQRAFEEGMH